MSVPVIKAICRRIEDRMGSGAKAAAAAGVSGGLWSQYANDDHPTITIPVHRLLALVNDDEASAMITLFRRDRAPAPTCLMTEVSETTEASADLQREAREALADGDLSELEKRRLRQRALNVKEEANDVLKIVGASE